MIQYFFTYMRNAGHYLRIAIHKMGMKCRAIASERFGRNFYSLHEIHLVVNYYCCGLS